MKSTSTKEQNDKQDTTHLLRYPSSKFPTYTRLDSEHDVFCLNFPWPASVFCVDQSVGEDL